MNALRAGARFWLRDRALPGVVDPLWPAGAVAAAVLLSSVARVALEPIWLPFMRGPTWILSIAYNYAVYGFVLMLAAPCLVDIAVRALARQPFDAGRLRKLLQVTIVILVPCYPAVAAINILTRDPFLRSIPVFRHIPGFLVHENFLPTGMIVVILLLFWKLSGAVMRLYDVGRFRALAGCLLGLLVIYLIFYQWYLKACYVLFAWNKARGHVPFWFFYTAGMLIFLALFVPRLRRVYPDVRGWIWAAALGLPFALALFFPTGGVVVTLLDLLA